MHNQAKNVGVAWMLQTIYFAIKINRLFSCFHWDNNGVRWSGCAYVAIDSVRL